MVRTTLPNITPAVLLSPESRPSSSSAEPSSAESRTSPSSGTEPTPAEARPSSRGKWDIPFTFFLLNASVIAVFWTGWSWTAVGMAVLLYWVRMFGITGVFHRYLSHRTYKTSRPFQFVLAFLGTTSAQQGPLWWAAHHRHHHRFSDQKEDPHSPIQHGFWVSHGLWWGKKENTPTRYELIGDLKRYPELVWLNRFYYVPPVLLALSLYAFGEALAHYAPGLGTNGLQMVAWGFVISTVVLFHGVATINSLAHQFGSRPYQTSDTSRNNFWLALLTLGEGWHNNHHHYCNSVRQGFCWWEVDITYYVLWCLSKVGLVWDLKPVPSRIREARWAHLRTGTEAGAPGSVKNPGLAAG